MSPPAPSISTGARPAVPRPPAPDARRPAWARRHRRSLAALAALLLITTVVTGRPGAWQDVRAPRGQSRLLLLPDSTRVVLDADSHVRYRTGFRGWFGRAATREVQLVGSGFFDVRRDGRAFVVRTYNANVRVLGTAFSVDAWEADATGTAVHVAEGRVAVEGASAGETLLQAGERAIVSHASAAAGPAASVAVAQVAPWRDGGFAAIDEPLGAVLPAIARRYDVAVQVTDSAVLTRRLTLYMPDANVERLLGDIATMQGLVLERSRDGYRLRSP
jgi:ferric-dicitrate binding protein FerR (iron transport regulator)